VMMQSRKSAAVVAGTTLASSALFFVVTNFGVWAMQSWYPKTAAGLIDCYALAIPFLRNTVAGDVFYVAAMFGIYEAVSALVRNTRTAAAVN
jgi:hypothetical protein